MTSYTISYKNPATRFIDIEAVFNIQSEEVDRLSIYLPAWRPGRYELGDFAKNVKGFLVKNENGQSLPFSKFTKNGWLIECEGSNQISITYQYYAAEFNAGSTYLSDEQLYINPVNCLVYRENREEEPCTLNLKVPTNYQVATSLESIGDKQFKAISYHELADSPLITSSSLLHKTYKVDGILFHLWFQGGAGVVKITKQEQQKVISDFEKFTQYQMEKFDNFPVDEYHFLFQITTIPSYHGVEHQKSTVIQLGPSYDIFGKLYTELLGVSSHELYHTWNIKAIRPDDLFPYEYSRENYSRLGFVAEGVTTYMGDRVLYESGVFDRNQYLKELGNYVTRHFHNDGRKHYSVAASSFDTWLDGYAAGTPGRKTSIYTEGCLIAYICDMRIRKQTKGEKTLHDVMRDLYELTNQRLGYSAQIYQQYLERKAGTSFQDIFDDLVNGTKPYEPYLLKAFQVDGIVFNRKHSNKQEEQYGCKVVWKDCSFSVISILEDSASYQSELAIGDRITSLNGIRLDNNLSQWLQYFDGKPMELEVIRDNKNRKIMIDHPNESQFYSYLLA